jgi:hypothetical protein
MANFIIFGSLPKKAHQILGVLLWYSY